MVLVLLVQLFHHLLIYCLPFVPVVNHLLSSLIIASILLPAFFLLSLSSTLDLLNLLFPWIPSPRKNFLIPFKRVLPNPIKSLLRMKSLLSTGRNPNLSPPLMSQTLIALCLAVAVLHLNFGGSGSDPPPLKMSVIAYFWQSWPCWLIWNRFEVVTSWAELARFYSTLIKGLSGAPHQKKLSVNSHF